MAIGGREEMPYKGKRESKVRYRSWVQMHREKCSGPSKAKHWLYSSVFWKLISSSSKVF